MNAPTPGWNPDPSGRHEYRYWDGSTWTDDVSDHGVTSVDPINPPGGAGSQPTAPYEPTQAYGTPPGAPGPPTAPGCYGPQGPPSGGYQPMYGSGPVPPAQPPRSGPSRGLIIGLAALAVAAIAGIAFALASGGDDDDGGASTDTTDDTSSDTTEDTSSDTTEDTSSDTTADSETTDVFAIGVGDCLTDESSVEGDVTDVQTIACDQPHAREVYHSYIIEADELPGQTEMESIVEEQCLSAFDTFVGMPYADSKYDITYLPPTDESWSAGDRELLCLIFDPAGNTTGSLQGSNQ
jgi:Septum formation/Protein of unknown function (DUF2510)